MSSLPTQQPTRTRAWRLLLFCLSMATIAHCQTKSLLLDLSIAEPGNRDQILATMLEKATDDDIGVLLDLAGEPELCGTRLGEIGEAIQRLGHDLPWAQIEPLITHTSPITRFLGMQALQTLPALAIETRCTELLASPHADVRARAALALRHHPSSRQALADRLPQATAPAERLSIQAALDWIDHPLTPPETAPPTALLEVHRDLPPDATEQAWASFMVPAQSKALAEPDWQQLVRTGVENGASLWLVPNRDGGWPEGVTELLAAWEIPLPRISVRQRVTYCSNLLEPTPIETLVHDVAMGRVRTATDAAEEQLTPIIARIGEWFPQAERGFTAWDKAHFSAPFVGLQDPALAPMLIVPRHGKRGRIVLDLSGIQLPAEARRGTITEARSITWQPYDQSSGYLQLWETGNHLKALLQGPASLIPLKQITTKYGILQKPSELIPAPYFDVDTSIVTQHVPWAKPLAGTTPRVGLLMPEDLIRSGVEIQQRLSLEPVWIPWSEHYFFGSDSRNENRRMAEIIDAGSTLRLHQQLAAGLDTLVIPGLTGHHERMSYNMCWDGMLPDLQNKLLQRVREGMGLVVLGPGWLQDPTRIGAKLVPASPAIRAAFPFADGADPGTIVKCYELGKGRVVHVRLTHFMGWAEAELGADYLAPGLASLQTRRLFQDEYTYSLDCAAILWASRHDISLASEHQEVRLADRFGRRVAEGEAASTAIRETRYLTADGDVQGWRVERVPARAATVEIAFNQRVIDTGQPLAFTLSSPDLAKADHVRIEVLDTHGRHVVQPLSLRAERALQPIEIPGWDALTRWHDVYVQVRRDGTLMADGMLPFAVEIPRHPHDLRTILFPGPTPYAAGLVAAGIDAVGRNRFHAYQPAENLLTPEATATATWDSYDYLLRFGIEAFGGSLGKPNEDKSSHLPRYQPSLHSPTFHQSMRDKVGAWAEPHRLLGWPSVETIEEFTGPDSIGFSDESLTVFRRELFQKYQTLAALNTAWERDFATWQDVMPDTLPQAIARRQLVSWTQHHAFMERAIANWQEMGERYYQQVRPDGTLSFWTPQFDKPFGLADVSLISRASSSHFFYAGRDTTRLADMMAPGGELGIWYPFCYDRELPWSAQLEAHHFPHSYLLQRFNTYGVWWGFEKFQWPFLRPDFTLSSNYTPLKTLVPALQDGIDRIVLGAAKEDHHIAVVFDQNSYRTSAALNLMSTAKGTTTRLMHDWQGASDVLRAATIRPTVMPLSDIRHGRLQRDQVQALMLFGLWCLSDADADAIRAYVEQGGTVIADVLPGTYTEDAAPRRYSPLADLFGVKGPAGQAYIAPVELTGGKHPLTGQLAKGNFQLDGGEAHGTWNREPAWITHTTGRGTTLLLNAQMRGGAMSRTGDLVPTWADTEQRTAWSQAIMEHLAIAPEIAVDLGPQARGRQLFRFRDGDRQLIGITHGLGTYDRDPPPYAATITTTTPKVLYTLHAQNPPQTGTTFTVPVPRWEAAYLLFTDQPLAPLTATATLAANRTLAVSLTAPDAARRVAIITVTDPTGQPHPELRREVDIATTGTARVPIAWNAPAGTWSLTVTDCITHQPQTLEVTIP